MDVLYVVYSVFKDEGDYRSYFDLLILDKGIGLVFLGKLPRVFKKRPSLPRRVELQLLQVRKERYRSQYTPEAVSKLLEKGILKLIKNEDIIGVSLREVEIPIPPILWKPPPPGEEPKRTEKVLSIEIYVDYRRLNEKVFRFFTSPKLKEEIKKALKQAGLYLRRDILESMV